MFSGEIARIFRRGNFTRVLCSFHLYMYIVIMLDDDIFNL